MLPKVETESLGLTRSYGEQGHMPRNMQGKIGHSADYLSVFDNEVSTFAQRIELEFAVR